MTSPFDRIDWSKDERSFSIDGVSYFVEQHLDGSGAPDGFRFYKPRSMVDQYALLFHRLSAGWRPRTIVELGIWHGGSAAFWTQVWKPEVLVGIDCDDRQDTEQLSSFRDNQGIGTRICTHWNTDQTDIERLQSILETDGAAAPDLVIDDASHKYRQTRASFEGLFPRLRPGGIYIIEDWSWSLDQTFLAANPGWRGNAPLAPIIADLSEALFHHRTVITSVAVFPDFIAIERGSGIAATPLLAAKEAPTVVQRATTITRRLSRELRLLRHRR